MSTPTSGDEFTSERWRVTRIHLNRKAGESDSEYRMRMAREASLGLSVYRFTLLAFAAAGLALLGLDLAYLFNANRTSPTFGFAPYWAAALAVAALLPIARRLLRYRRR